MKRNNPTIDLSYARAAQVFPARHDELRLVMVGCGGTGSFLAPSVARLARVLQDAGRQVKVVFIDHDRVEDKNIPRQNFCAAELGLHKAVTLAARFSLAWNLEIAAVTERFDDAMLKFRHDTLTIVIGCVDNAAARKEIAKTLARNTAGEPHDFWWLDCGNFRETGQVLLGSAPKPEAMKGAFFAKDTCKALPSPALQAPDLLEARPEEMRGHRMSCAELSMLNAQSLMVNQRVAAEAADYLLRLTTGGLQRFATYFDLASGTARSLYVTPEEVARATGKPVEFVQARASGRRAA